MEHIFIKYINDSFKRLIEEYGFKIKNELNDGHSYMIEFCSDYFVLKIEKYFREFYTSIYKINDSENEVNLFNLLEYLKQNSKDIPKSDYFRNEKNIEECYRKQIIHISSVIYENYDLLNELFCGANYELKIAEFENYWSAKHPELYKRN